MSWCAFIGDEVTGAGFRLAGVEVFRPALPDLPLLLDRLREQFQLILITAEFAESLPPGRLRAARLADWPLVLVIADVRHRVPAPSPVEALRRQLGLSE